MRPVLTLLTTVLVLAGAVLGAGLASPEADAAAAAARAALAQRLGLEPAAVEVVEVARAEWPDACLGLPAPDELCAQMLVPGYRVLLRAEGGTHEARTDLAARTVRLAEAAAAAAAPEGVRLETPAPQEAVTSPLVVRGAARGSWSFEGAFTARLLGPTGAELAVAPAELLGPWTTEDFVPFEAELAFEAPAGAALTLVLERANPSGLPENAEELRVPLTAAAP